MTTAPDFLKHGTVHDVAPLRGKWKWILALGIVYVVAGALALGSVVTATFAGVLFVGAMMILAGVAQVVNAFQVKGWGSFFLWLLLGVLYIFAGFAAFENPLMAAKLLTLTLGIVLVASGVVRLVLAFSVSNAWAWVALSALITLILGVVILAHWPTSSLYILGLWLGIDLIFAGSGWISFALGLRRLARA
jgi:uncharacterized membrane protein HdeD (DUF308 family)